MKTWIITAFTLAGLVACHRGQSTLGQPMDRTAQTVKLAELMEHPNAYQGKLVRVEGRIGKGGCVDCGGVLLADKTWRLSVEPEDPKAFTIPTRTGARLVAWGVVSVEPQKEGAPFVELKARGVELP